MRRELSFSAMCLVVVLVYPSAVLACPDGTAVPVCQAQPNGFNPDPVDPGILSGSWCRGACGGDCPPTCAPLSTVTQCVDSSGPNGSCCGNCDYNGLLRCGTHEGCRYHDWCYDACASSSTPWNCRRGCDLATAALYGPLNSNSWRKGGGPYDAWMYFTYGFAPTYIGSWPGTCGQGCP